MGGRLFISPKNILTYPFSWYRYGVVPFAQEQARYKGIEQGRGMFGVSRGLNLKIFAAFPNALTSFLNMANPSTRVSAYSSGSPTSAPLKRVGTHNGSFHCDEALGCFMIRLTHNFSSAEIVRTRDPQVSRNYYIMLSILVCIHDECIWCSSVQLIDELIADLGNPWCCAWCWGCLWSH